MTDKILRFHAIGDPHISKRHISLSNEAIENSIKFISKKRDIHFIIIMGDILDQHDDAKLTLQRKAIDWVKRLCEIKMTVVLIGNHDRPNNQDSFSEIHPFMGLEDVPGKLYIVNKPKAVTMMGENILFMPYVPRGSFISRFNEYMNAMHMAGKWSKIRGIKDFPLIFAHQEFKGACYGPVLSTKGDEWPLDHGMVVSGHIHTRTRLQENIYYTGSLYPVTIAESNDKGIITCSYNFLTKKLDTVVTRMVLSQKKIYRIEAKDESSIIEMVSLDREHTKYVISGSAEEVAKVKSQTQGKNLNISYNVEPSKPSPELLNLTYDSILRSMVKDPSVLGLLEEIMNM